jgi:hypothetical protein
MREQMQSLGRQVKFLYDDQIYSAEPTPTDTPNESDDPNMDRMAKLKRTVLKKKKKEAEKIK